VFFARNELRRANGPVSSRDMAEKIAKLEGKDPRDRRLRNDMVKSVGKSLKLLRQQGIAESIRDGNGGSCGGWGYVDPLNFGHWVYPMAGSFDFRRRMNSISFAVTSASVAVSDSHRISLRIVKSRNCSLVKSRAMSALLALPK
jgi:hypothetical protein